MALGMAPDWQVDRAAFDEPYIDLRLAAGPDKATEVLYGDGYLGLRIGPFEYDGYLGRRSLAAALSAALANDLQVVRRTRLA